MMGILKMCAVMEQSTTKKTQNKINFVVGDTDRKISLKTKKSRSFPLVLRMESSHTTPLTMTKRQRGRMIVQQESFPKDGKLKQRKG